jgi:hypothetical protein
LFFSFFEYSLFSKDHYLWISYWLFWYRYIWNRGSCVPQMLHSHLRFRPNGVSYWRSDKHKTMYRMYQTTLEFEDCIHVNNSRKVVCNKSTSFSHRIPSQGAKVKV